MREALHFEKLGGGKVRCLLCPHRCSIADGDSGRCGARANRGGTLFSATYGLSTSFALDPVEKKPLYHFMPGSRILSIGQNGCNLECAFCQNWRISRGGAAEEAVNPQSLADSARKVGSIGIAYTYNEPLVGFEFVKDSAALVKKAGLANVLVTNGYINPGPLEELLPFIHALNVDIKSIRDGFYKRLCKASLKPVQETLRIAVGKAHVEVTNLVIPGENDKDEEFEELADWLATNLGPDVPVHLSAYFPAYKLTNPPTPKETLSRARSIVAKRMKYVYMGNIAGPEGRDTVCASCGKVLIERHGYDTRILGLKTDSTCADCGAKNNIILKVKQS